jgi:hypothetical protein
VQIDLSLAKHARSLSAGQHGREHGSNVSKELGWRLKVNAQIYLLIGNN